MVQGDETWAEHGDANKRRHRIGALQDLSRARTNLEHATGASTPDPETVTRLEEIERELAELSRTSGSRSRKRNERRVLDLLLSERLLLDQLGFATYAEYAAWCGNDVSAEQADLTDLAYLEFARMELEAAEQRLDALDHGEPDPATAPPRRGRRRRARGLPGGSRSNGRPAAPVGVPRRSAPGLGRPRVGTTARTRAWRRRRTSRRARPERTATPSPTWAPPTSTTSACRTGTRPPEAPAQTHLPGLRMPSGSRAAFTAAGQLHHVGAELAHQVAGLERCRCRARR